MMEENYLEYDIFYSILNDLSVFFLKFPEKETLSANMDFDMLNDIYLKLFQIFSLAIKKLENFLDENNNNSNNSNNLNNFESESNKLLVSLK